MSEIKKKGQKSRDRIIEVAIRLFSEKGYDGTSAQEVADICGISQTTVFYHFKNKKILFSEILNYVIQNNRNIFDELDDNLDDPFDRLVLLLRSNIQWCYKFPEQTKIVLNLFTFAASDDEIKELATNTIDKGRLLVKAQLEEISKNGHCISEISIIDLSIFIQQYVNAVMFQMLARNDVEEVYASFNSNVRSILKKLIYT